MKYEIVTRMRAGINIKLYDIVQIVDCTKTKKIWDQLLSIGNCTEQQYIDAEVFPGIFKYPWSPNDMKENQIFILDEFLTETEFLNMQTGVKTYKGLDSDGLPSYDIATGRAYKLSVDDVTYFSTTSGKRKKMSPASKAPMKNPNILVAPRYDKPVLKSEILAKV